MGTDMGLRFNLFEVAALVMTTIAIRTLTADGRSTWIEGLMLLAIYLMLAIGFCHLPAWVMD
jgi:Ca2+:H+ antiporter